MEINGNTLEIDYTKYIRVFDIFYSYSNHTKSNISREFYEKIVEYFSDSNEKHGKRIFMNDVKNLHSLDNESSDDENSDKSDVENSDKSDVENNDENNSDKNGDENDVENSDENNSDKNGDKNDDENDISYDDITIRTSFSVNILDCQNDKNNDSRLIDKIKTNIDKARIVICDITPDHKFNVNTDDNTIARKNKKKNTEEYYAVNPNVMYEIGLAEKYGMKDMIFIQHKIIQYRCSMLRDREISCYYDPNKNEDFEEIIEIILESCRKYIYRSEIDAMLDYKISKKSKNIISKLIDTEYENIKIIRVIFNTNIKEIRIRLKNNISYSIDILGKILKDSDKKKIKDLDFNDEPELFNEILHIETLIEIRKLKDQFHGLHY